MRALMLAHTAISVEDPGMLDEAVDVEDEDKDVLELGGTLMSVDNVIIDVGSSDVEEEPPACISTLGNDSERRSHASVDGLFNNKQMPVISPTLQTSITLQAKV
jgi:hypothetical protein